MGSLTQENKGMLFGIVGVAIFSLTLPFTRIAVAELNPVLIGLGRAVVAACAAGILLWWRRAPLPQKGQWQSLIIVALGCVIGFSVLSSIAMRDVPATHGAIVVGMLPMATALCGALRFGERPSVGFWIAAGAGSAIVVGFALWQGGGTLKFADLALIAAVVAAAFGYAEGGRLSQQMGGQQVISWALIVAMPVLVPVTCWLAIHYGISASPRAWGAFAYVSLFSMFIGFFFWYKGLALGGIARVGQVQLLQPFLTLIAATFMLGEGFEWHNLFFTFAIIAVVLIGKRMPIRVKSEGR